MEDIKEQLKQTAIKAAKEAGAFLMENIDKVYADEVQYDSHMNPTTKIDSASEKMIIEIISSAFPDHAFFGEELGKSGSESEYKWIIDPIDGTNNYVAKRDTFSVSIGLEHKGEIVLGVVFLPKRNEMFVAEKGRGAILNDKPIHVGLNQDLVSAIITYSTYPGSESEIEKFNKKILNEIPNVKYLSFKNVNGVDPTFGGGSMAAEFCYVSCGRLDGLIRAKQKPWDVAAGSLIVSEAGARLVNLEGGESSIYEGNYIAGNSMLVEKILETINND